MKSPAELAKKLTKQWENPSVRESRILHGEDLPIRLAIGKPSPALVRDDVPALRRHLDLWRNITIGKVITQPTTYRSLGQPIDLPTHWEIQTVDDWIKASDSSKTAREYATLQTILRGSDSAFLNYFVRMRSIWLEKNPEHILKAAELSTQLSPNIANGAPLRTISLANIDTKFIERNRNLIIHLLDIRYHGKVSELGLENFLGAWHDNDHWVLVSDLNNGILPFSELRARTSELSKLNAFQATQIIIIENEKCLHQLPKIPSTIAILGCGLNLSWMQQPWLKLRHVAYWGDIDTWGLTMLDKARAAVPAITPLLMTQELFDQHQTKAVAEPTPSSQQPPRELTPEEQNLYIHLLGKKQGRLEQEFLPTEVIHKKIHQWTAKSRGKK